MGILTTATCAVLLCAASAVHGSSEDSVVDEHALAVARQAKLLCHSTDEYIKTLKFLRQAKELILTETTSRLVAEKVARGCDGASERFSRVLVLLKTVGLSDRKALALALDFSSQSPEIQRNFTEIFTRAFLGEFFDYDYQRAATLAYELSRDYHGDPVQVREDFIELVRYCKDGKTLDLPSSVCAELTIKLARLSQFFPSGVRQEFYKLYKALREKREFSLNVKSALEVSYSVLKNGPTAPDNFFAAFTYATRKDGLDVNNRQALSFALRMADRSYSGTKVPLVMPSSEGKNAPSLP